jgi:polar amino acid transport system substrate-binding protein
MRILKAIAILMPAMLLLGCAAVPDDRSRAMAELAPTGTLRVAINLGNPVLAGRDPLTGELQGVSIELARKFSADAGLALRLVSYASAGKVVEALSRSEWDLAFLAVDPVRAEKISFTEPYLLMDGVYLVRDESPIRGLADVDLPGIRIVVGAGSTYDLFLSRKLKFAHLVRTDTSLEVVSVFLGGGYEVAAGVRRQLARDASRIPGLRLIDEAFMNINQAIAVPAGRPHAAQFARDFVSSIVRNGFARNLLESYCSGD